MIFWKKPCLLLFHKFLLLTFLTFLRLLQAYKGRHHRCHPVIHGRQHETGFLSGKSKAPQSVTPGQELYKAFFSGILTPLYLGTKLENHLPKKTPLVGIVASFPRGIREMVVTKPFKGGHFLEGGRFLDFPMRGPTWKNPPPSSRSKVLGRGTVRATISSRHSTIKAKPNSILNSAEKWNLDWWAWALI